MFLDDVVSIIDSYDQLNGITGFITVVASGNRNPEELTGVGQSRLRKSRESMLMYWNDSSPKAAQISSDADWPAK